MIQGKRERDAPVCLLKRKVLPFGVHFDSSIIVLMILIFSSVFRDSAIGWDLCKRVARFTLSLIIAAFWWIAISCGSNDQVLLTHRSHLVAPAASTIHLLVFGIICSPCSDSLNHKIKGLETWLLNANYQSYLNCLVKRIVGIVCFHVDVNYSKFHTSFFFVVG